MIFAKCHTVVSLLHKLCLILPVLVYLLCSYLVVDNSQLFCAYIIFYGYTMNLYELFARGTVFASHILVIDCHIQIKYSQRRIVGSVLIFEARWVLFVVLITENYQEAINLLKLLGQHKIL